MFILDDLAFMVLEGIVDYTNSAYLTALENQLKGLRLLYERGEIEEDQFRELDTQLADMIKNLRTLQMSPPRRSIDINLF